MMAIKTQSVAAELIRLLYRQVPAVLAANLINSNLVVAALWQSDDQRVLVAWASAVLALSLMRVGLWTRYRFRPSKDDADGTKTARWGWFYTVGSTASGLLWGMAAVLFVRQGDPISLLLISFVLGGMAAGAVTSLSSNLPAFYLYLLTSLLPLGGQMLVMGDRVSLAICGMAAVYAVGLVVICRNFNAALIRALTLNEENAQLLASMEEKVQDRTSDLQAANAMLTEARAEAEQANQAKSRFLAAASHDLRQPLQSMFLFANALHHHVSSKSGMDALVRIERGLDVLKGMLDSLLDVSRLDVNVIQPELAVFPLGPMLDDICVSYRRVAASKRIELCCGPLNDVLVHSDQGLLGRMVRNLVENAIRYTETGQITLSTRLSGGHVHVDVTDTGIGIAADQLDRIFEEFHQIGNPERDKARGLGLGLAIVQRLSTILDHPVDVRSILGEGSTFSIQVPAVEGVSLLPAAAVPAAGFTDLGRSVALIDDDPLVLLALGTVFEGWGYAVTMAGSKEEALGRLQPSAAPHLIVADYRLRNGKVGSDAIKGIRAACGVSVPSIILTGETGRECETDAEELGAMVLHKPVTPNQLDFALKRLFGDDGAR
jgi:signal transduction histidine kinase/ActR/RegA family two-component response regulator